jgi:hypothetical protein
MRVRRALPYSTVKLVVMRNKAPVVEPVEGEPPPPPSVEQSKEFEKLEIPVKLGRQ